MKILIAGDFCPMDIVVRIIEKENYRSIFVKAIEYIKLTGYSIVNHEAPVVKREVKPIDKCGLNIKCTSIY